MSEDVTKAGELRERSHPRCWGPNGHICQEPSGRLCVEKGCYQPAGTKWGPHWCPDHDVERLDRVSAALNDLAHNRPEGGAA